MATHSAVCSFQGQTHKDIYYQGHYHKAMYRGSELIWKKLNQRKMYCQYFIVDECISKYGDHPIDEYGAYLLVNPEATVTKCGIYLQELSNGTYVRTIACKGKNIKNAAYVPYVAYKEEIIYDGVHHSDINTYSLESDGYGVWSLGHSFKLINANLYDKDGAMLTVRSQGYDSENARLFTDSISSMSTWLYND